MTHEKSDYIKQNYCPCGGIILADTEDWKTPICNECYEALGEPEEDPQMTDAELRRQNGK